MAKNKSTLLEFTSLGDLPPPEEINGSRVFLKTYQKIFKINQKDARELMAKYLGRKPMSIKKKLKSIIKEYNFRCCWPAGKKILNNEDMILGSLTIITVKDIKDLEEKLLDETIGDF